MGVAANSWVAWVSLEPASESVGETTELPGSVATVVESTILDGVVDGPVAGVVDGFTDASAGEPVYAGTDTRGCDGGGSSDVGGADGHLARCSGELPGPIGYWASTKFTDVAT
jgi:hypothetical protein